MPQEPVIEVRDIAKSYYIGDSSERRNLQQELLHLVVAPLHRLQSLARTQLPTDADKEFWALQGVNLDVYPGETVGIVGKNGSGKSTLLKIISKVLHPTQGHVRTWGELGTLLEVNAGFNPELTGRENIYLKAAHHGLTTQQTDAVFDDIVDFSEIPQFLNTPLKRYSTGMGVRLGFAISAMIAPDILIVDEAFAVGDAAFREKCVRFLESFHDEGKTILLVSHSTAYIRRLCDRIIWLNEGEVKAIGETDEVMDQYLAYLMKPLQVQGAGDDNQPIVDPGDDQMELTGNLNVKTTSASGSRFASIHEVSLLNNGLEPTEWINIEDPFYIDIEYEILQPLTGQLSMKLATYPTNHPVLTIGDADINLRRRIERKPGTYHARLEVPPHTLDIGEYALTAAIHNPLNGDVFASFEFLRCKAGSPNSPMKDWYQVKPRAGVIGIHLDWQYLGDEPVEPADEETPVSSDTTVSAESSPAQTQN